MRMNGHFRTMDAYQAGYLALKGFAYDVVSDGGSNKYVFCFTTSPELYEELSNYGNGAVVEASHFASTIKLLKGELFSLRREKESQEWNKNR